MPRINVCSARVILGTCRGVMYSFDEIKSGKGALEVGEQKISVEIRGNAIPALIEYPGDKQSPTEINGEMMLTDPVQGSGFTLINAASLLACTRWRRDEGFKVIENPGG